MKINELRRSSAIMPKQSSLVQILQYANEHGVEDTFISFTSVDKLGINPRSTFATPNGIYAYPISLIVDGYRALPSYSKSNKKLSDLVPYAGSSPYVTIFKTKKPYLDLANEDDCEEYLERLYQEFGNVSLPPEYKRNTIAEEFWSTSLYIASKKYNPSEVTNHSAQRWNNIMRRIGCAGVFDSAGEGIIHESESTQAVFFSLDAIEVKARIVNTARSGANTKTTDQSTERFQELHQTKDYQMLKAMMEDAVKKKIDGGSVHIDQDVKHAVVRLIPGAKSYSDIHLEDTFVNASIKGLEKLKLIIHQLNKPVQDAINQLSLESNNAPRSDVNYNEKIASLVPKLKSKKDWQAVFEQNKVRVVNTALNIFLSKLKNGF